MTARFECWVGMDLVGASDDEIAEFNDFYDRVHVPEVLAGYGGFVAGHRFELIAKPPDAGVPRWLAIYEIADHASVESFRTAGPPGGETTAFSPGPPIWRDRDRRRTTWRVLWDPIFESSGYDDQPRGIYLVGMNVPGADSPERLAEFHEFYDTVHGPEVLHLKSSRRLRRYRRRELMLDAYGTATEFVAVYDLDAAQVRAQVDGTAPPRDPDARVSAGPASWESRDTRWRLSYRLLSSTTAEVR
jgi:hypothetical protein